MHALKGPDDARRTVEYWAGIGVTSFKAYTNITRDELGAAIKAAHARGLKVTGHLCSVTFREAAALGIDDLEHGLLVASDFVAGKKPDDCPDAEVEPSLLALDPAGEPLRKLIRDLVDRRVAVTSTLPVFETFGPHRPPLPDKVLDVMTDDARIAYLRRRARIADGGDTTWTVLFKKEMAFELAFAKAGGLLLAGTDPTGYGGVVAGFSNQREVELLVEAGFTPLQAISIATLNGSRYLGREQRVGTVAAGKQADLIVVRGDPATNIADIENVEIVFKDGVGYDPEKLIASVRGKVGLN
jgi:imidazolonepropionase-like amidohydrolase